MSLVQGHAAYFWFSEEWTELEKIPERRVLQRQDNCTYISKIENGNRLIRREKRELPFNITENIILMLITLGLRMSPQATLKHKEMLQFPLSPFSDTLKGLVSN